jgi:hypothetical protein
MNQVDPLWLALSKLRRGKLDECIAICDEILSVNPNDQVCFPNIVYFLWH